MGPVFDCQSIVTQPRIDAVIKNGGSGFLRYYYNLSTSEIDLIVNANGLQLGIIGEVGNGADYVKGFDEGLADADLVNRICNQLGVPDDGSVWIWYTNDTSVPRANLPLDEQWASGIDSVKGRPAAFYTGNDIAEDLMAKGLAVGGWIPAARSWSQDYYANGHCNLRQLFTASPVANTDENEVLTPFWGQMGDHNGGIVPGTVVSLDEPSVDLLARRIAYYMCEGVHDNPPFETDGLKSRAGGPDPAKSTLSDVVAALTPSQPPPSQ